ncbi:phytase [Catenovulum sediminis]|uniref:phytase n=1 Tax=Catenovulum sediminis TaxID=1740262 RepID=UPI00117F3A78|nr:phytase [Catenovulum sediminis]
MINIKKCALVMVCFACFLQACVAPENNSVKSAKPLNSQALYQADRLNGHKMMPIGDEHWLGNSENFGVFLLDKQGEKLLEQSGNFEALDVRPLNNTAVESSHKWLVSSIEKELGQLQVFSLSHTPLLTSQDRGKETTEQPWSIETLMDIRLTKTVINNVCLYQSPTTQDIYAFLLTAQNQVEQRLIYLAENAKPVNYLIRQFPAPPESSACAVDDVKGLLYISEEMTGIWQYSVDAEKELSRQAVALVEPFGQLSGEIKDIFILQDGSLLVALPDISQVQHYQLEQKGKQAFWQQTAYQLEGRKNESISALQVAGEAVKLVYYDDENPGYYTAPTDIVLQPTKSALSELKSVKSNAETAPVKRYGDAADDPAIWVNAQKPEHSLILATDKSYGLYVYNLAGEEVQSIASGRINNIDVSYQVEINGQIFDFAAASNRTNNSISLYKINADGKVSDLAEISTSLPDVYGLCNYYSSLNKQHYVFINDESGLYQQYQINFSNGQVESQLVREFKVNSQPEGCVADSASQTLYLGEEDYGIWSISAEPDGGDALQPFYRVDNKVLFDDVEGLSIYHGAEKYLIASSQGNDSYVVFSLEDKKVVTRFKITADPQKGVDGASETDGLAVTSANLGGQYTQGLLVVQDGRNVMPVQPQNFKLVAWQNIQQLISSN